MIRIHTTGLVVAALLAASPLLAEAPQVNLQIKTRAFEPAQVHVPAGIKIRLVIHNADSAPAEFESYDLSREVVVPGGGDSVVYIGPLDAGSYKFFNDFYPASTGTVIAAPASTLSPPHD
ncbi:MAG: cupredoxin domain-containing protein [Gammaproteobacteria bacterium]|nr:cupredoxin domain-containing protein [Gammaproteobacteria bacterium]